MGENLLSHVDLSALGFWAALGVSFLGGILSFLSPCVLPLIPAYLTFITGLSVDELSGVSGKRAWGRVILASFLFVLGLSTVFVGVGGATGAFSSFFADLFSRYLPIMEKIGGVIIILFGIYMMGFFKIPFLEKELKARAGRPVNLLGSYLVGFSFAFGWTPCIGPILVGILLLASTQGLIKAVILLAAYSLGFSIPFLISALFVNGLMALIRRMGRAFRWVEMGAGALLVLAGVLVFLGVFRGLAGGL